MFGTGRKGPAAPLRVLVVGPVGESGGMARVARMTAEGFDPKQFDIAVCDTAKDTPAGRSFLAACLSHLRRSWRLIRLLRLHRPGVVHIHTCSYATFYRTVLDATTCHLFRRPYILHLHGGLFDEFLASLSGVRRRIVAGVLRGAVRVVAIGAVWRTRLAQQVSGLSISVIRNAVEPSGGAGQDRSRGGGVLFVGDLSEVKRPEDLLVAYAALPSPVRARFPLSIIGDGEGPRRRRLKALAERLGVAETVRLEGSLPHDAIRSRMRRADLLVLPSRAEGMPLVLLEAMQAALPVVATRVGSIPETVTDGVEAVLVAPGDTLALARQMKELLGDEARRCAMGRAARLLAKEAFSLVRFRMSIVALWTEATPVSARTVAPPLPKLASSTFRTLL